MAREVIIGRIGIKVTADIDDGVRQKLERQADQIEKSLDPISQKVELDESGDLKSQAKRKSAEVEKEFSDPAVKELHVDSDSAVKEAKATKRRVNKELSEEAVLKIKAKEDAASAKRAKEYMRRALADTKAEVEVEASRNSMRKVQAEIQSHIRDLVAEVNVDANKQDIEKVRRQLEDFAQGGGEKQYYLQFKLDPFTEAKTKRQVDRFMADIDKTLEDLDVKVNFRKDMAEAKRAARDMAKDMEAFIDVRVDEATLRKTRRQILETATKIEDTRVKLKTEIDDRSKDDLMQTIEDLSETMREQIGKVNTKVAIDFDEGVSKIRAQQAMSSIDRELDDIFVGIHPFVDPDDVQRARADVESQLIRIQEMELKLKTDLDPVSKRKVESEIKALRAKLDESIELEINPMLDRSNYVKVLGQIHYLTKDDRKQIFIDIVNAAGVKKQLASVAKGFGQIGANLTGSRLLWDLHKDKFEAFKNFDQVALKAGTIATGLAAGSAYLTSMAGDILSVASDMGSIVGLLPVMASGLGMVKAQSFIFKQAFSDVTERFPEMNDGFTQLGVTIRDKFWAEAETAFSGMYDKLFPEFEAGMSKLAASTGGMFAALSDGFTEFGKGRIGIIFENWAQSTDVLKGSMGALSFIMMETLRKGSEYLPRIAQGFTDAANGMAGWLNEASNSGQLDEWINRAIDNTKALASTVWDTGVVLATLGDYAQQAGSATLEGMAETMAGAVEVVKSAGFREGFVAILTETNNFVAQLSETLASHSGGIAQMLVTTVTGSLPALGDGLSKALGGLLEGLTDPAFAEGVNSMFTQIGEAIGKIAPALEVIGPKLGIVFGFIGGMFSALLPVIGSFVEELAVVLEKIHAPVDGLLQALGPTLQSVVEGISPLFAGLGTALATLATHLTPAVATLGQLGPVIAPIATALGGLATTIAEVIGPMLPMIAQGIVNLWSIISPVVAQLVDAVSNLLTALKPVIDLVISALPMVGAIVGVVIGVIIGAITGLINGITSVIEGVKNIFGGLITFFTGVFTGNWKQAWEGIKQVALGIWQVIKGAFLIWMNVGVVGILKGGLLRIATMWRGGWTTVWNFVKSIWDNIVNFVRTKVTGLGASVSSGINFVRTVWSAGWKAVVNAVTQAALQVVAKVISMGVRVKTAISTAINTAKAVWAAGWGAMKSAASRGVSGVVSLVGSIPAKVRAIFSGAASILVNAGQQIISGLINGIQSMVGSLTSTLGGITRLIPNKKGPIEKDRRLLIPAGKAIMGGLISGIDSKIPELRNELQDITKLIEDSEFKAELSIDASELDRLDKARALAGSQVLTAEMVAAGGAGMVNNFEMHMGNQYTPEDVSGEILFNLRRTQRSGVYRKE